MYRLVKLSRLLLLLLITYGCSSIPDNPWYKAVPEKSPFVIIPAENVTLNSVVNSEYIPFLEDVSSSALSLVAQVDSSGSASLPLNAIVLYPGTDNRLEPIWISRAPGGLADELGNRYQEKFTQNNYYFSGIKIHKLHMGERSLFAAQLNGILMLSESSLGIEDGIRSYLGSTPDAGLGELTLAPGSIVMNTPSLDQMARQLGSVTYRPYIKNALKGTKPALLQVSKREDEENTGESFEGDIPLSEEPASELVAALSHGNAPLELDQYISSNAAAFGIFRLQPTLAPPRSVPDTTRLDSILMNDKVRYAKFAESLDAPFALVMYAESGFLSTGEHLFLRKLNDRNALQSQLNSLVQEGLADRSGGTYYIQSRVLSQLIGSELSDMREFYLDLTGNVVVISKRKGLAEVVASDRSRRRVIYYESNYRDVKSELPEEISGLFIAGSEFYSFISPFLSPENYASVLASRFDLLAASTQLNEEENNLNFSLRTYKTGRSTQPYEEKWLFPIGGAELSGEPVLADIGGSGRDEVIFATENGSVYALAADGTVVFQLNTGGDRPVGSPVVYDWYATNQNVILLAAGNKIYGWDDTGSPLPQFPFELGEAITSPLTVADINRDGLPEIVVGTADRRLHAIEGRGNNLSGWPLTTNSVIRSKPVIDYFQGSYSVLAFSENAVHAWFPDGVPRSGFPKFVNASLNGSPYLLDGNILGGAADGYLYSIGNNNIFADSLNIYSNTSDSTGIAAVYVSNSALAGTPSVHDVRIQTEEATHSGSMILTMSSNGSVFLVDKDGQLRFTQSMGQPAATGFSPFAKDITNDNLEDVIALANFGRLYAWEIIDGERIYALPTTGMNHPIMEDIDGDQYVELIARTQEGLRCWTIYGVEEEDNDDSGSDQNSSQ